MLSETEARVAVELMGEKKNSGSRSQSDKKQKPCTVTASLSVNGSISLFLFDCGRSTRSHPLRASGDSSLQTSSLFPSKVVFTLHLSLSVAASNLSLAQSALTPTRSQNRRNSCVKKKRNSTSSPRRALLQQNTTPKVTAREDIHVPEPIVDVVPPQPPTKIGTIMHWFKYREGH